MLAKWRCIEGAQTASRGTTDRSSLRLPSSDRSTTRVLRRGLPVRVINVGDVVASQVMLLVDLLNGSVADPEHHGVDGFGARMNPTQPSRVQT